MHAEGSLHESVYSTTAKKLLGVVHVAFYGHTGEKIINKKFQLSTITPQKKRERHAYFLLCLFLRLPSYVTRAW